jgi:hypothetical protein
MFDLKTDQGDKQKIRPGKLLFRPSAPGDLPEVDKSAAYCEIPNAVCQRFFQDFPNFRQHAGLERGGIDIA